MLEELALFYRNATEPHARLLICAIGILLVAGFRISELLTLPADGLQKRIVDGREKWYIRYWQRKPGEGQRIRANKRWLSPAGSELARVLWDEVRFLTEPARKAARHLEECDQRGDGVRIPWIASDAEYIRSEDVDRAFGLASSSSRAVAMNRHGIKSLLASSVGLTGHSRAYRRSEVEALLLQLRGPLLTHCSGKRKQYLSGTLLIYFEQFMDPRKRPSEVLVRRLATDTLASFLNGQDRSSPLSAHLKARTHGFRHWLNTIADKSGMSAFLISVWMQRTNIEQTLVYLHDPLDIADLTREGLRDGRLLGPGADRIYQLGETEREEQIDSIEFAHIAATVICVLDLTHEECSDEKACEFCDKGYFDPENPPMRNALHARRHTLLANLERLERLRAKGVPIHERQFEQARELVEEIDQRLARSLPVLQPSPKWS